MTGVRSTTAAPLIPARAGIPGRQPSSILKKAERIIFNPGNFFNGESFDFLSEHSPEIADRKAAIGKNGRNPTIKEKFRLGTDKFITGSNKFLTKSFLTLGQEVRFDPNKGKNPELKKDLRLGSNIVRVGYNLGVIPMELISRCLVSVAPYKMTGVIGQILVGSIIAGAVKASGVAVGIVTGTVAAALALTGGTVKAILTYLVPVIPLFCKKARQNLRIFWSNVFRVTLFAPTAALATATWIGWDIVGGAIVRPLLMTFSGSVRSETHKQNTKAQLMINQLNFAAKGTTERDNELRRLGGEILKAQTKINDKDNLGDYIADQIPGFKGRGKSDGQNIFRAFLNFCNWVEGDEKRYEYKSRRHDDELDAAIKAAQTELSNPTTAASGGGGGGGGSTS